MSTTRNKILLSALLLTSSDAFSTTYSSSSRSTSPNENILSSTTSLNVNTNTNVGGGVVLKDAFENDKASLLASAFDALNDDDKYDAVLTGLCSKILDGKVEIDPEQIGKEATLTPSQLALEKLKDPIRLMGEMNQRRVKASPRSLMALIDVSLFLNDFEISLSWQCMGYATCKEVMHTVQTYMLVSYQYLIFLYTYLRLNHHKHTTTLKS